MACTASTSTPARIRTRRRVSAAPPRPRASSRSGWPITWSCPIRRWPADGAGHAPAGPGRGADLPRGAHFAHPARHRGDHPAPAPGPGSGQAARLARCALERAAHLRAGSRLVRAGDALGGRPVQGARARLRRLPGLDARGLDAAEAGAPRALRVVRERAGHAPAGSDADPDRGRRGHPAGLSPRGRPGPRLVWLRPRRGGDPQAGGRAPGGRLAGEAAGGAGPARDQRHPARLRRARPGHDRGLHGGRRPPADPATAAHAGRVGARALRGRDRARARPRGLIPYQETTMSARKAAKASGKTAGGTKNPYGYPFWEWVAREDPEYVRARQPLSELSIGEGKELSVKYREMVIIGILAFRGRKEGVLAHMRRAIDHGATKRELLEAIQSAGVPGGGPTFSTGAQALMQLDQEGAFKAAR